MNKRAALVASLAVVSCGKPPAPGAPPPAATVALDVPPLPSSASSATPAPPPADDARELLRPAIVSTASPARRTLFTWTTREQAAELAKSKTLLTRSESPTRGASYYEQMLAQRARTEKLAALLRTKAFARARFAWPAPWATLLGWEGESYGDVLVGVTLKPEALVVVMRTSTSTFDVFDMENKPVPAEQALAHPERIAVVHFVHDVSGSARGTFAGASDREGYREYVLCNESMIAEWSLGTVREKDALAQSVETASSLYQRIRGPSDLPKDTDPASWNRRVVSVWSLEVDPASDAATLYEHAVAIPSSSYFPKREMFLNLARTLRAVPPMPALTHRPTAAFSLADTRITQPPPKVKPSPPRRHGTF